MGQAESVAPPSNNIDLESIARNVQTAVQRMIDAAVQNATSAMVEREKTKIKELEEKVVREVETLERTVSNLRQQKTAAEAKLLKIQRLEECMEKLEKRVGALEISVNTTLETIIPEAKALLESILQKPNTAETPTQTPAVDFSPEGVNVTISSSSSSAPATSNRSSDTTCPVFESTPISTASACPNPALPLTSSSPPSAATIRAYDTLPVSPMSMTQSTYSSACPNRELTLKSAPKPSLPPAFSASSLPDTSLPSGSTSVDRYVQAGDSYSSAAQPASAGTALSSPSAAFPASQRKKSERAFYMDKAVRKLHRAVEKGRTEAVRRLLEEKVNINAHGREGMTAAHLAAMHGNAVILQLLLSGGALVQRSDWHGWQALHWAAFRDRAGGCVALLAEAGSALDARTRPKGDTPLHLAAHEGNEAAAAELLAAGAKPGLRNHRGETPLDRAPHHGGMRRLLGAESRREFSGREISPPSKHFSGEF